MQYILFSMILVITLLLGIGTGLLLPVFVLKFFKINLYAKEAKKEEVQTDAATNITPDIMNEWMNGKGGD